MLLESSFAWSARLGLVNCKFDFDYRIRVGCRFPGFFIDVFDGDVAGGLGLEDDNVTVTVAGDNGARPLDRFTTPGRNTRRKCFDQFPFVKMAILPELDAKLLPDRKTDFSFPAARAECEYLAWIAAVVVADGVNMFVVWVR